MTSTPKQHLRGWWWWHGDEVLFALQAIVVVIAVVALAALGGYRYERWECDRKAEAMHRATQDQPR